MEHYAGIDVSLEYSSVCIVDGGGKIVGEDKVASEPAALIGYFQSLGFALSRIGLEAGPLSQWLYAAMKEAGLAVELLETRHVHDAFKAMPVKSDRNDARGIAQLMRLGWFQPVHCKSMAAQEVRAMLTARKLMQSKLRDVENHLRGILRGFGLKVGHTTAKELCRADLRAGGGPSQLGDDRAGAAWRCTRCCYASSTVSRNACGSWRATHVQAKLLMTTPAVGPIVGLTYACAIDDPARFKSSKQTGAHFGLTPKKYQSGPDRLHRQDQQDRRCRGARGTLSGRPCHADQTGQGLLAAQKLGDAHRPACWHAQGQGGAGTQACRDHASHARRRQTVQPGRHHQAGRCGSLTRRTKVFGRVTTPGLLEAKSLRRDDGSGQTVIREVAIEHASVDWPALSSTNTIRRRPPADPVQKQVPGDWMTQKGIDQSRPVTEARMSEAKSGSGIEALRSSLDYYGLNSIVMKPVTTTRFI